MNQESVALGIVLLVVLGYCYRFFRTYLSIPLAHWLLKRGKVKWAMYLRHRSRLTQKSVKGGSSHCSDQH